MEKFETQLTLGTAIILSNTINTLLNEVNEGKSVSKKLPFRLAYRLGRNKEVLDRDVQLFLNQKMLLIAQYGEISEDENNVVIKDEKKKQQYAEALQKLLATPLTHNVIKIDPEDLDLITTPVDIPAEALKLFIIYLTDDPEMREDLLKPVDFKNLETGSKSDPELKD